jgi:hypothetical protein
MPMELFGWVNKFVRGCCRLLRVLVAPKNMIFRYGISGNGGVRKAIMAPFCGVLRPGRRRRGAYALWNCLDV